MAYLVSFCQLSVRNRIVFILLLVFFVVRALLGILWKSFIASCLQFSKEFLPLAIVDDEFPTTNFFYEPSLVFKHSLFPSQFLNQESLALVIVLQTNVVERGQNALGAIEFADSPCESCNADL